MFLPQLSTTLASTALASLSLLLPALPQPCLADEKPFYRNAEYNAGEYGAYPQWAFKTQPNIPAPRLNFMDPFTNCDDGSYLFVAPRGKVANSSFYIVDHEGSLVWGPDHRYGEVYNFQVQQYQGEDYLFFWAGDDSVGGHGEGKYFMLDRNYQEQQQIKGGEGIRGDLHSFAITADDTAVYTGYELVQKDLSSIGKSEQAYIWESLFQELDIESGDVIFEWRASDHFPYDQVYATPTTATKADPWDFFHINMVEKDGDGNYLVSTRYGRCALYIDGRSGDILWQLGGVNNSFTDLSDGAATTFLGQHDAHWHQGHDFITLFDNRADWFDRTSTYSQGTIVRVDLAAMTAELVQSFRHPHDIVSVSQGSTQMLPNGNVLVGWGFNGAVTEFSPDGDVLCDAYFMAETRLGSGDVQSYRNLKFNWTGIPVDPPVMVFDQGTLYFSWLGSTEVREWFLQDADGVEGFYAAVTTVKKVGFETEYVVTEGERLRRFVRVLAVDAGGSQLAASNVVDLGEDVDALFGDSLEDHEEGETGDEGHRHGHEMGMDGMGVEEHGHGHPAPATGDFFWDAQVRDAHVVPLAAVLALLSNVLIALLLCRRYRRSRDPRVGFEEGVVEDRGGGRYGSARWRAGSSSGWTDADGDEVEGKMMGKGERRKLLAGDIGRGREAWRWRSGEGEEDDSPVESAETSIDGGGPSTFLFGGGGSGDGGWGENGLKG